MLRQLILTIKRTYFVYYMKLFESVSLLRKYG